MPSPPVTVGRYQLGDRIAHGGMGVLYLAFDPLAERPIALKLLRVDSADLREGFLREARLAARLQHPNIVTIYDVGSHDGQPFIAMEFIAGETLAAMVQRRAAIPLSRRVALMEQVCIGLGYAHRHGIVHRDVKPANLMVSSESGILKVLDFGVAGHVDADNAEQGRMLMGTPNYMSPEQVIGQPADHRSDVFAVGLVLYELIAYAQAFSGDSQQAIMLKVLHESPAPLSALVPGLDPSLQAIVNRALEKSADLRYPDLDAMRSDLSRVGQRLEIAESAEPAGRGTPAARGRGRARQARPELRPLAPPALPLAAPPAALPAGIAEALAAAEREAYEERFAAAVRRLEALPPGHADVEAALEDYRSRLEARSRSRDQDEGARAVTDLVRTHVTGVLSAIAAGRWRDADDLLRTLERQLPGSEAGPAPTAPPLPSGSELHQDDEVAHYLSRARQRLEAGDITAAQALLDAALGVSRLP